MANANKILQAYLVFNRSDIVGLRKGFPKLSTGQRAIRVRLIVPNSLFSTELPSVDVHIPEELPTKDVAVEVDQAVWSGPEPEMERTPDPADQVREFAERGLAAQRAVDELGAGKPRDV